jgi:hypothetical protein
MLKNNIHLFFNKLFSKFKNNNDENNNVDNGENNNDGNNNSINLDIFDEISPTLLDRLLSEFILINPEIIKISPFNNELFEKLLKINGLYIKYIDNTLINDNCAEIAVTQNGLALQYIPENIHSSSIYMCAVINNPFSIQYMKDEFITYDILFAAVNRCGLTIYFAQIYFEKNIIDEEQLFELLLAATANNGYSILAFDIKKLILKQNIYMFSIYKNVLMSYPEYIREISCIYLSKHTILYDIAVYFMPMLLKYVPTEFQSEEMCYLASVRDFHSFEFAEKISADIFSLYKYIK